MLFSIFLVLLLLAPVLSSEYHLSNLILGSSESASVESGSYTYLPFSVQETSNVSSSFRATLPVEAFILTYSELQSIFPSSPPSSFESASGNLNSGSIEAVLSAGNYYLAFFNFGNKTSRVTFDIPRSSSISSILEGSTTTIVSKGSKYTLTPGQYFALKLHIPENSSTSYLHAYFLLTPPAQNMLNYYGFGTISYLMNANQFESFLQGETSISSIYSTETGFFLNAIQATLKVPGDYYFVTYDPSTTQSMNMTFPEGFNVTSFASPVSLVEYNPSISIRTFEYLVNFTSSGDVYYVPLAVTLNGQSQESASPMIFLERNGTYAWDIFSVGRTEPLSISDNKTYAALFDVSPTSGEITVHGEPVTVVINFQLVLNTLTFVESGLPLGSTWSVSMNATTHNSTNNKIAFNLPNYPDYSFVINAPPGYGASPSSGTISLEGGANVSKHITFAPNSG